MQVFEYYGQMSENGQLNLPDELKKQLEPKTKLRVMIFLEKGEQDWKNMTAMKFSQGYAEEDKIYDDL